MKLSWNQPCCERCWLESEGEWDLGTDGTEVWQQLISVRQPVRLLTPEVEQCAWCGHPTIFGVFKRADPNTVLYPHHEREEADDEARPDHQDPQPVD